MILIRPSIFLALVLLTLISYGQKIRVGDSLEITFNPMGKEVKSADQLQVIVEYKNISRRVVTVYDELDYGYSNEKFANVSMELERRILGRYTVEPLMSYRISDDYLFNRTYRHFDPTKSPLAPSDKIIKNFDFKTIIGEYDTGYYRIRLNLRVNTIWDLSIYEPDSSKIYNPPIDKIEYISSDWIYFYVPKKITTIR
jgi:hypothetical protein